MEDLIALIKTNPDPRVLKRALAVKMSLQCYPLAIISEILQVSISFPSKWKGVYLQEGITGLELGYEGPKSFLSPNEYNQVILWLKEKNNWNVHELECYLIEEFDVVYVSKQSYYDLFHAAGLTYKKAQRSNPRKDPEAVEQKKKDLAELGHQWAGDIAKGDTVVLLEDECHLHYRDVQGYTWGKSHERVTVEMKNENNKQTYYGALDVISGKTILRAFKTGDTKATIKFIRELMEIYKGKKIKLIWDGASYHRSAEFIDFLQEVNGALEQKDWLVECVRLAPYAPEENPIEYIWLEAKSLLRSFWHLCKSFKAVRMIFELGVTTGVLSFSKLDWYKNIFSLN